VQAGAGKSGAEGEGVPSKPTKAWTAKE